MFANIYIYDQSAAPGTQKVISKTLQNCSSVSQVMCLVAQICNEVEGGLIKSEDMKISVVFYQEEDHITPIKEN